MTTAGSTPKTRPGQPGLRDRKRLETRSRLEEAAVALVLQEGLEHATIEAISDRAGVSPRTFFNYFDSKEDAVLGVRAVVVDAETLRAHAAEHERADPVESVVGLLFAVFGPTITDAGVHRTRLDVLRRFPQLLGRQLDHMTRATQQLTTGVQAVLSGGPGATPVDAAVAETILSLCVGALRIAMREWVAAGTTGDTDALQIRTITLVRDATERIQ